MLHEALLTFSLVIVRMLALEHPTGVPPQAAGYYTKFVVVTFLLPQAGKNVPRMKKAQGV
ncbi:MAG: hypothetical protein NC184_06665 [Roseburia sp.]|nr:hypothetical protein [Roseburia sp.]